MLHTKLRENLPTGSGEEYFEHLLACGRVEHCQYSTQTSCTQNVVPPKHGDLGSRSINDLGLNKLHTFIGSISCLHLATFKCQAETVSKISIVFAFPHVKAFVSKIELTIKYVKVIPGSSFEQTMIGWSPQRYKPNFDWFWRRRFLKKFYHIWVWRPSWSCNQDIVNKISMPLPKKAPHKIST